MENSTSSDSSWNPSILEGAFDEAVWVELDAFVSATTGTTIERKQLVSHVAALPWRIVSTAVSNEFFGVPKKQLLDALALVVSRATK